MAWQPEQGQLLAAPGPKGIVLYERDSWHPTATLAQEAEIQTLCFSADGVLSVQCDLYWHLHSFRVCDAFWAGQLTPTCCRACLKG